MRKLTLDEYRAQYVKQKKDLPATYKGTLKDFLAEQRRVRDLSIQKKAKYFNLKITKTPAVARREVEYASCCAKWGSYNPYTNIVVTYIVQARNTNRVVFSERKCLYKESLGHGSNVDIKYSKLYATKKKQYKDAEITIRGIQYKNKFLEIDRIMYIGSVDYHYSKYTKSPTAYKELQNKIAIRREKQQKNRIERAKKGIMITPAYLQNKFGWCAARIEEFRAMFNLPAKIRLEDLKNKIKQISKQELRNFGNPVEVRELINFLK